MNYFDLLMNFCYLKIVNNQKAIFIKLWSNHFKYLMNYFSIIQIDCLTGYIFLISNQYYDFCFKFLFSVFLNLILMFIFINYLNLFHFIWWALFLCSNNHLYHFCYLIFMTQIIFRKYLIFIFLLFLFNHFDFDSFPDWTYYYIVYLYSHYLLSSSYPIGL